MRRLLALFITTVLALAACSTAAGPVAPASGSRPGTTAASGPAPVLGLTYIPNIQFSPFYVADKQGLFGTTVKLRHHGASEGLFTALTTGDEQFVVAGGDELLQARAEGADLVAVASYYRRYPVRIIVPADSPITSAADLKGRTVGVPGRYGETWFGLKLALAGAGLTETDVKVLEIGYTQQAALATQKVDAVMGFVNGDAVAMTLAGFPTRSVELGSDVGLVSICLITTRAYATAHPDTVRAVVRGTVAGMTAVVKDPAAAVTTSEAYVPGLTDPKAKQTATAVLAATTPLFQAADGTVSGRLDQAQWQTMSDRMVTLGLLTKPAPANEAMTNDYLG
ncbi:MAG TPA: ABC transporter substrate-binding protein [Propionibacteriaceae bacterium]|mgnify:CR=1 FL=1|nr:ABC transporter substrate-binding protein [Propionibacteriaceae bacterium]